MALTERDCKSIAEDGSRDTVLAMNESEPLIHSEPASFGAASGLASKLLQRRRRDADERGPPTSYHNVIDISDRAIEGYSAP